MPGKKKQSKRKHKKTHGCEYFMTMLCFIESCITTGSSHAYAFSCTTYILLFAHKVASFKEMAQVIAQNWKQVDPVTKTYAEAVAKVQKDRYKDIKCAILRRISLRGDIHFQGMVHHADKTDL